MLITVRLWSTEELRATKHDKWLATLLMNHKTHSKEELIYYTGLHRRVYQCKWVNEPEPITIYATDERMLLKFIDAEYTRRPDFIHQVITQYRPVKV